MVQETGVVESLDGEFAFVRAERSGTCDHCASKSVCTPGGDGKEYVIVQAVNTAGANPGDMVKFEVPAGTFLKASLIIYAIPMVALLIGSFVGKALHPSLGDKISIDGASALSALIFLVVSIFIVKLLGKRTGDIKYFPKIIEIIG